MGIEYARRLLGHSNISTTQRYMHLDDRELAFTQDLVKQARHSQFNMVAHTKPVFIRMAAKDIIA